jgi:hypothetical protein
VIDHVRSSVVIAWDRRRWGRRRICDESGRERGTGDGGGARDGGGAERDAIVAKIAEAMERLRGAVEGAGATVENHAEEEWVQGNPELRLGLAELNAMVDDLAARTKAAFGEPDAHLSRSR